MTEQKSKGEPLVVGILGGIASGKSTVARLFEEFGATVIDADAAAGEALRRPDIRAAVQEAFGDAAFGEDGSIDRATLARIVFDDAEKLETLNRIVHPPVAETIRSQFKEMDSQEIAVLDVPLLFEFPVIGGCDLLVFVEAPLSIREVRARDSRGWPDGEIEKREGHQAPLAEKKKSSRLIIRNDGTLEDARRKAASVWKEIVEWRRRGRGSDPSPSPSGKARPSRAGEDATHRTPSRNQPKEVKDG